MDLKCHEKVRNQENFFNFLHKTNFNAEKRRGINRFVGDNVNCDLVTFVGCMN